MFAVVAQLHRVGGVVFRICVNSPPLLRERSLAVCSITLPPLYVLTDGGISTGLMHSSSFAEKMR